jgi:hypothetical protein
VKNFKYAFGIILTSMPRSCIWSLPQGFPQNKFLISWCMLHVLPHFILFDLVLLTESKVKYKVWSSSLCYFLHSSIHIPQYPVFCFLLNECSCFALFYSVWLVFGRSVLLGYCDRIFIHARIKCIEILAIFSHCWQKKVIKVLNRIHSCYFCTFIKLYSHTSNPYMNKYMEKDYINSWMVSKVC